MQLRKFYTNTHSNLVYPFKVMKKSIHHKNVSDVRFEPLYLICVGFNLVTCNKAYFYFKMGFIAHIT